MSASAIENICYEKGWDVLFEVSRQEERHRFCVRAETLSAPGLRSRTKRTFPEVFEANRATLLRAAELLIVSRRMEPSDSIGGTEILASHIGEVTGA